MINSLQLSLFDLEETKSAHDDIWEKQWIEIQKYMALYDRYKTKIKTYWNEDANVKYYSENTCDNGHKLYSLRAIKITPYKTEKFWWMEEGKQYYSYETISSGDSKVIGGNKEIMSMGSGADTFEQVINNLLRSSYYIKSHSGSCKLCEGIDIDEEDGEEVQ